MAHNNIYKTWEDGFVVRRMMPKDATIVQKWYGAICPTACDLDIVLQTFPPGERGFYIGEYEGQVVASAIRIPWSDNIYYGSYYYVEERYRKMGFGRRLRDEVAAEHVGSNILCIDAHDDLEAMNKRKGYTSGFKVILYKGKVIGHTETTSSSNIVQASEVDFENIMRFDSKYFVKPNSEYRRKFMEKWLSIKGGLAMVAKSNNNEIVGLGCRRPAFQAGHHLIGPLYAESAAVAHDVLLSLTAGLDLQNDTIWINVCEPNKDAMKVMCDLIILTDELHMLRMHLNGDPQEYKPEVYALTSIDVCGF